MREISKIPQNAAPLISADTIYRISSGMGGMAVRRAARSMFERFSQRARRVVVLAQEEARMLNHNYIGTEHILLGLIREGSGVAARALESLGISLEAVRQQVEQIIGRGQQAPSGHVPFTPRAKKVLELSLREAKALGHNYIGTEHILLGLIREGSGVAAQVLVKLGADLNRVRHQVVQLLYGYQGEDVAGEDPPLPDDALTRVDSLDRRLAAIERWVGLRPDLDDLAQEIARVCREKEAAIDRQDFETSAALRDQEKQLLAARASREKEWAEAAGDRLPLAQELGRVKAELERLRASLREHGIEPGDDAA
jgi:ATP-dependent Clp protease ATP-binding subunit ClpA